MDKREITLSETNLYDIAERIVVASRIEAADPADYALKRTNLFIAVLEALEGRDPLTKEAIADILGTKRP